MECASTWVMRARSLRARGISTSLMTAQKLSAEALWHTALVNAASGRVSAEDSFLFTSLKGLRAAGHVPSLLLTSLAQAVVVWQDPTIMSEPEPLLGLSWCFVPPCTYSEPCRPPRTKIWKLQCQFEREREIQSCSDFESAR